MPSAGLIIICAVTDDGEGFSSIALNNLARVANDAHGILVIGADEEVELPIEESEHVEILRYPKVRNRYRILNLLFEKLGSRNEESTLWALAETSVVNDELDKVGVRDAAHMVETGIIDVACANQRVWYYDRSNLEGSHPFMRFSGAMHPVEFGFGGFAIYDSRILKIVRFNTGSMYDFNKKARAIGARFAVVPWMVNSGYDRFYVALVITCLLTFAALFVLLT